MKDRIISFLNAEKLTPARFADIIGVQPANISHIISERNKPSLEFAQKMLAAFPNLNPEWLIMGNGNMYKGQFEQGFEMGELFDNQNAVQTTDNTQNDSKNIQHDIFKNENSQQNVVTEQNSSQEIKPASKEIERIIICYSDKTFEFYSPR